MVQEQLNTQRNSYTVKQLQLLKRKSSRQSWD